MTGIQSRARAAVQSSAEATRMPTGMHGGAIVVRVLWRAWPALCTRGRGAMQITGFNAHLGLEGAP